MTMNQRQYNELDNFIIKLDQSVARLFVVSSSDRRQNPSGEQDSGHLAAHEKRVSQGLMRVNHSGEVAAQALYQGQSVTARSESVKNSMLEAAEEEIDHLNWCQQRLQELNSHTSFLNPVWYLGSFSIGALAGLVGDKWSLGFVAETEHQVVKHLASHLQRLPAADDRSRAILEQMQTDEARHATIALEAGAADLPGSIKKLMSACSKVMTRTAYWI